MKVTIQVSNSKTSFEFNLDSGKVTLGRSSRADFKVQDEQISGVHCSFFLADNKLQVSDHDSKNGTYLNGIRIDRADIFLGDEIKIGHTSITLLQEKMDEEAIEVLSFPGVTKERLNHELKADFTQARIANQSIRPNEKGQTLLMIAKEVNTRKRAQTKILVSKQEIKARHPVLSFLAQASDLALLLVMLYAPLLIMNLISKNPDFKNRTLLIVGLEIVSGLTYWSINMRGNKFSLGEKWWSIKRLYEEQ